MSNPFATGLVEVPDAGGYGVFAVMDDGDVLCRACVVDPTNPVHDERNPMQPCPADTDGDGDCAWCARTKTPGQHPRPIERDGWGVIGFDHTGNTMDVPEHCSHCNKEIA